MNILGKAMLIALLPAAAAWATTEREVLLDTVGPAPGAKATLSSDGTLQVFSAREKRDLDVNQEIFLEDEGEDVLCDLAHTDYTICDLAGKVIKQVRNARDANDDQPTVVRLAPGLYEIKADTKDYGSVSVPVVIKAGKPTVVNLQGDWRQIVKTTKRSDFVWLHGTEIVGWRARGQGETAQR
jgi:hypothetical protein